MSVSVALFLTKLFRDKNPFDFIVVVRKDSSQMSVFRRLGGKKSIKTIKCQTFSTSLFGAVVQATSIRTNAFINQKQHTKPNIHHYSHSSPATVIAS